MKKLIVAFVLTFATVAAFAMPKPSDIENALAAHDYQSAKSMTQEVLREKPDSPKAHLFNAYVLLKADRDPQGAAAELKTAAMLDKGGSVKHSALFGRTVAELQAVRSPATMQPSAPRPVPRPVQQRYDNPVAEPQGFSLGFKMMMVVLLAGAAVGAILLFGRPKKEVVVVRSEPSPYRSPSTVERVVYESPVESHYSPEPAPRFGRGQAYSAPAAQVVHHYDSAPVAPQRQGMGMMGTAASVAGGVVAGNLISDMLHNGSGGHRSHSSDYDSPGPRGYERSEPAYQPAPSVSYDEDRASFSSGSDDTFDAGSSSSSSSDDSWGGGGSSDSGGSWDD